MKRVQHLAKEDSTRFIVPEVLFGTNSSEKLSNEAKKYGDSVLLVTDKNIKKVGILEKIMNQLEGLNVKIYEEVGGEPTLENLRNAAKAAKKHDPDLIIGVGGGSVLDTAKAAAVFKTNTGDIQKYIGKNKLKKRGTPSIFIPTTAGTGSEVTQVIVVSDSSGIKKAISDPFIAGDLAIVDPLLTTTCPPKATAAAGADALSHAFEAVMSTESTFLTDSLAAGAITLCYESLEKATLKIDSLVSRYNMSMAATMAGISVNVTGVTAGHGIAYTYSHDLKLPHGLATGLALPHLILYNSSVCREKLNRINKITGLETGRNVGKTTSKFVKELLEEISLPTSLKEIGVSREEISKFKKSLFEDYERVLSTNPKMINEKDAEKIFLQMWKGELDL